MLKDDGFDGNQPISDGCAWTYDLMNFHYVKERTTGQPGGV